MWLFKKEEKNKKLKVTDDDIVAMADGEMIDVEVVPDPTFSEQMMGKTIAFTYKQDKVTICSPANGTLAVLFPTGHAFGIVMNNGVELLVHIGIDTVESNGNGFKLCGIKQGKYVKAGEPIVEVDIKLLSQKYNMSTMLIITNSNEKDIVFADFGDYKKGDSIIK